MSVELFNTQGTVACVCGRDDGSRDVVNGLTVLRCQCGIMRQFVTLSAQDLSAWYADAYFGSVYHHDYEHDHNVALARMAAHRRHGVDLASGNRLLDIGSGLGAFVDAAREEGVEAYGCDPHGANAHVYTRPFLEIGFPTEWCDVITMHDTLEHVTDPLAVLRECARILRQGGSLVIDFPDFHSADGVHHWKPQEHIWLLTVEQLCDLVRSAGFAITATDRPIASKIVIYAKPLPVQRQTILIPPGIGDCYWVLCKLESFIAAHGLGVPQVEIASLDQDRDRSLPYVEMAPFLKAGGYRRLQNRRDPIWHRAYMEDGEGVFQDVLGCQYFLSANGPFRFDKTLDQIMPGYQTNWYPRRFMSLEEERYADAAKRTFGTFVVAFFTHHGMYQTRWLKELPVADVYRLLKTVHERTGVRVLLTGASWDRGQSPHDVNIALMHEQRARGDEFLVDCIGQTSLPQFFGLLQAARGCIGFCGGNTIMSVVMKRPTVIIWNDYFRPSFWRNACPPDSLGRWYEPVSSKQPWGEIAECMYALLGAGDGKGE